MYNRRYAIVANYLYRTYPKLRVGFLTAIRQRLVQNVTLAKFARMYKMDQALELAPEFERLRNDTKSE
jgi:dsRNA-specific ribonuclease